MVPKLNRLVASVNEPIDLSEIGRFPVLRDVLEWWEAAGDDPPNDVDPLDLPPRSLAHLMLVDLQGTQDAVIRLAGTLSCDMYGRELKGTSVHDFFDCDGAALVLDDLHRVAAQRSPMLTRRRYVSINGKPWSYVRLLLPLQPDGRTVTRVLKALEPTTFRRSPADPP